MKNMKSQIEMKDKTKLYIFKLSSPSRALPKSITEKLRTHLGNDGLSYEVFCLDDISADLIRWLLTKSYNGFNDLMIPRSMLNTRTDSVSKGFGRYVSRKRWLDLKDWNTLEENGGFDSLSVDEAIEWLCERPTLFKSFMLYSPQHRMLYTKNGFGEEVLRSIHKSINHKYYHDLFIKNIVMHLPQDLPELTDGAYKKRLKKSGGEFFRTGRLRYKARP